MASDDRPQPTSARVPARPDLAGRTALVTGGSRGIGRAIAAEFLARGASVVVTARKAEPLEAAAAELRAQFCGDAPAGSPQDRVLAVAGNTGHDEDRAAVVAAAMDRFGSLDILINNTGINPVFGALMDADLGGVRKIFDTNVVAALGYVQEAYKAWMGEHGGAVVNIASVAGLRSSGVISAYGASKAALIRLTEELAWQLAPAIRVNAVAPGVIDTSFASVLVGDDEQQAARKYPMGRIGTPEDVARAVAFLVSDEAEWLTGDTVRVDGGLLATGGM
ncbi:SDR family oxidoreductase [Tomitella fengzijianii]|uniref:SDR family oxidoreductase n=1 Tax=Tomitella fengzijianii TaxID=2597660 RepID=UPI00131C6A75|nr:SDR family oxidoreductase [Tomitella fengzijianii]